MGRIIGQLFGQTALFFWVTFWANLNIFWGKRGIFWGHIIGQTCCFFWAARWANSCIFLGKLGCFLGQGAGQIALFPWGHAWANDSCGNGETWGKALLGIIQMSSFVAFSAPIRCPTQLHLKGYVAWLLGSPSQCPTQLLRCPGQGLWTPCQ